VSDTVSAQPETPDPGAIAESVRRALAEDVGSGDLTAALVPADARAEATIIAREDAVVCGTAWAGEVFRQLDPSIRNRLGRCRWRARQDGSAPVRDLGTRAAYPHGRAHGAQLPPDAVRHGDDGAALCRCDLGNTLPHLDTRKTIPGLREAQKYAVRCGGCHNHRHGLYDGILIKVEPHRRRRQSHGSRARRALAGGEEARHRAIAVEVEVETLDEVREALAAGADILLLDDFSLEDTRIAVALARAQGHVRLEASGGIQSR
jgi:nicotinate-nucleotide pyrophosphorylase (carboxylating)